MSTHALVFEDVRTPAVNPYAAPSEEHLAHDQFDQSETYSLRHKHDLQAKLFAAARQAGDQRVDLGALRYAAEFLWILPSDAPEPDIVIEEDGEVAFDWDISRRATFSVSVGPDGTLRYGGLFGHRTRYGSDQLTSSIPPEVLSLIAKVGES